MSLVDYINNLYQQSVGREGDAGGINYWTDQINSGRMTQDQVANAMRQSQEAQNYRNQTMGGNPREYLSGLYQENLGRTGFGVEGGQGIDFWQNEINTGVRTPQEVADLIRGSDEAIQYRADTASQAQAQAEAERMAEEQPIGLKGQELAVDQGYQSALSELDEGTQQGRQDIQQGLGASMDLIDPNIQASRGNTDLMAALTGGQGRDAQAQAYSDYMESPGQEYLRSEAERALLRNQSAIGGLGGGNVRRALQEQAVGLAAQDFGNSFNRMGTVAQLNNPFISQGANLQTGAAQNLGNASINRGLQGAQYGFQRGGLLSDARGQAGRDLANVSQGIGTQMANLGNQQGAGIADIYGSGGASLAGLLSQGGQGQSGLAQNLLNLLSQGSLTQPALQQMPGTSQTQGNLGGIGSLFSGVGGGLESLGIGL